MGTSNGFNNLKFEIRDSELWFSYHVGGAIMGSGIYCKVNEDGKASIEHHSYLDFRNTPTGTLLINQSVPPGGENLLLVPTGKEEKDGNRVGNPNLIYGWHIIHGDGGNSFGPDRSTAIIGNDAYVMGSLYPDYDKDLNKIYK